MGEDGSKFKTVDELLATIKSAIGHPFRDFDVNHRLDNPRNKGALGQIVEEGILKYPVNSRAEADLAELGIEIKTTGLIKDRNGNYKTKERLTLETLNYSKVSQSDDFQSSQLWEKIRSMLFVFYEYDPNVPYGDMKIVDAALNKFSEVDLKIMEEDYDKIVSKIREGRAEDISEGDTMYLGACTAGTGALISQPYSDVKAKQRKFCLKTSYFAELARNLLSNSVPGERLVSLADLSYHDFDETITSRLSSYIGLSESDIRSRFGIGINPSAKNRYERYVAAMLGIKGKISDTDEFKKAGIKVKVIRVQAKGGIKESVSFPYFHFKDIVSTEWEQSDIREMFASTRFCFVIFNESENGEYLFGGIKFWNMDEKLLDEEVKPVYQRLKSVLETGDIVAATFYSSGKLARKTNFPGMSFNAYVHVRPHGRDASDADELPVKDKLTGATMFTKQCFWLNASYVLSIIKDKGNID